MSYMPTYMGPANNHTLDYYHFLDPKNVCRPACRPLMTIQIVMRKYCSPPRVGLFDLFDFLAFKLSRSYYRYRSPKDVKKPSSANSVECCLKPKQKKVFAQFLGHQKEKENHRRTLCVCGRQGDQIGRIWAYWAIV
jgi:hypothetical protein